MSSRRLEPKALLLALAFGVPLIVAVGYSVTRQLQAQLGARELRLDEQLIELHRMAIGRKLDLVLPGQLDDSLQFAGFSPRGPAPRIPRTKLVGGAVTEMKERPAAVARYESDAGPFTLVTYPATLGNPPRSVPLTLGGAEFETLSAGDVMLVLWRRGNWIHALGGELKPGDREMFVDLARRAQGS